MAISASGAAIALPWLCLLCAGPIITLQLSQLLCPHNRSFSPAIKVLSLKDETQP
ncbi:hypothetical protein C8T65DRAFT_653582 [Cerioporus squamosus]|nr:hypothetical protein C8T65DRAFT_653582 [Cerioporus squamosus]